MRIIMFHLNDSAHGFFFSVIFSIIYSFNESFMRTYAGPATVLGARDTAVKQVNRDPSESLQSSARRQSIMDTVNR